MTVFKFRLATLLRMREAVRDERRTALAEAYEADRILAERIEEMQQRHRALYDRRAEAAGPGAVKVDQLLDAGRYEFVLQAEQKTVASQRQQLSEEIEKRRTALAEIGSRCACIGKTPRAAGRTAPQGTRKARPAADG